MPNLPHHPKTAAQLISLMEEIWDADPLGLYNEWHNARTVAIALSLRHTGNSISGDDYIYIYRFPQPPFEGVRINAQGSSISLSRLKRHRAAKTI